MTNLELYEVLKSYIGEDGARMIAEVVPPARELATRADIAVLKEDHMGLRAELVEKMAGLRAELLEKIAALAEDQAGLRAELLEKMDVLRADLKGDVTQIRVSIKELETKLARWLLGFFAPVWVATWVALLAVLVTR